MCPKVHTLLLTASTLVLASASGLSAQESASQNYGFEEIMVTAQKRAQSAQDVPLSVSAFNANTLERVGAIGLDDITSRTPNFEFSDFGELKLSAPSIRGVFQSGSFGAGADPSVGFYLDEVYLGNNVGNNIDLFDVERVEVLRGPQGTLFGRNTTGGAVNITTRKPSDEFEGSAELTYGNYDYVRVRGYASGPIVEGKLLGKISGVFTDRDGLTKNNFLGNRINDQHNWGVRGQLLFLPTDRTEITFTLNYREVDQSGGGYEIAQFTPFLDGTVDPNYTYDPGAPDDYAIDQNVQNVETLEAWDAAMKAVHSFDSVEFTSITSYSEHDYFSLNDTDRTPFDWIEDGDPEDRWAFSQELRLASTDEGRFDWIVGLYYFHQFTRNIAYLNLGQDFNDLVLGIPFGTEPDIYAASDGVIKADSYAGYAHGTYDIGGGFEATLGLRLTHDKKKLEFEQNDVSGVLGAIPFFTDSDSWTQVTGDAALSYFWNDDVMTYVRVNRGYKSGGFNDAFGAEVNPSFNPERVWNFEGGIKSQWFDNRLIFNATVFHLIWNDIQIADILPGQGISVAVGNFGKAESTGLELEMSAMPIENLEISGNIGYLDAEFTKGNSLGNVAAGDRLPGPKFSAAISAAYTHSLGNAGELTGFVEFLHKGKHRVAGDPLPAVGFEQKAYQLLNARLTYAPPAQNWRVSVWGRNLTDETYVTRFFDLSGVDVIGSIFQQLGDRRTYGVDVSFDF